MSDQLPSIGTVIIGQRRKPNRHVVRAEIVPALDSASGRAVLFEGKTYNSLTAAARVATGYETNGWNWWKHEDGTPLKRNEE